LLLRRCVAEPTQVKLYPVTVDDHNDAGALGAGGHQVVIQGGQHVIAVFKPRHHALADAKLTSDFDLGKIRCPLRPAVMTLTRGRPEILTPPGQPPACRAQQTITMPPQVTAKTRQEHDYPSAAHRKSYRRRTGAERTISAAKDPASNNIARGWTRLLGLTPLMPWLTCLLAIATSAS
jgi:hypothetical protein